MERPTVHVQIATEAQFKTLEGIDQSKARRLVKKRVDEGCLTLETYAECTGLSLEEVKDLVSQDVINFEEIVTKRELASEVQQQIQPVIIDLKQEIIENLNSHKEDQMKGHLQMMTILQTMQTQLKTVVADQANFATQDNFASLKTEIQTIQQQISETQQQVKAISSQDIDIGDEIKKIQQQILELQQKPNVVTQDTELKPEIKKIQQQISELQQKQTPEIIDTKVRSLAATWKTDMDKKFQQQNDEIAKQIQSQQEELQKHTDDKIQQNYRNLDRKIDDMATSSQEQLTEHMQQMQSTIQNIESSTEKHKKEAKQEFSTFTENIQSNFKMHQAMWDEQSTEFKRKLQESETSINRQIEERQNQVEDALTGIAFMMCNLQDEKSDAKVKQPESTTKILEVINNWEAAHSPDPLKLSNLTATKPKANTKENTLYADYAAILQYQSDKEPNKDSEKQEEKSSKPGKHRTRSKSRGRPRWRSKRTDSQKNGNKGNGSSNSSSKTFVKKEKRNTSSSSNSGDESSREPSSDTSSCRSRSPQLPKMAIFDGRGSPTWESFIFQFERTAERRHWSNKRKIGRLFDCLKDTALEYARKIHKDDDFESLVKKMKRRFSKKPEPVTARRQLQYTKQQEDESIEEYAHKVYMMAMDGYEKCEVETLEAIATEAFLRGCKEKEAAMKAMEKNPQTLTKAVKYVKTSLANQKALFGSAKTTAYAQRQVSFSDTEGATQNEPSYTPQSTCLEHEIKNLSSLIGKLSSSIDDNNEKKRERQNSPPPNLGFTPRYTSPNYTAPRYTSPNSGYTLPSSNSGFTPRYASPSPQPMPYGFNQNRSPTKAVSFQPAWNSPNRQTSPNKGQYWGQQYSPNRQYRPALRSPPYREQGRGRGQYQGQYRGFTPQAQQYGYPRNPYYYKPPLQQEEMKPNLDANKEVVPIVKKKEQLNQDGSD